MRKMAYAMIVLGAILTAVIGEQSVLAASQPAEKTKPKTVAQAEPAAEKPAQPEEKKPVMVTVAEGDTLSSIAQAKETTWVRLYNANESVTHPDIINPGQELRVPAADEQLVERALPQPPAPAPAPAPVQTGYQTPVQQTYTRPSAPAASYPVSSNGAKAFIYNKESGNNPNATNPSGCYGIGQDCNGVLRTQCGADYACQDAYFDRYAASRYGSWEAAYSFWQANGWW